MSADRPDPRNPLARALDEASSGADARGYAVPVDLVRHRAGRRRALRTGGVAALALAVVGGAAVGIPAATAALRTPGPALPAPSADGAVAGRPAQFDRCGQSMGSGVQLVLPDVPVFADATPGPAATHLSVDGETATMPSDGEWSARLSLTGLGLDGEAQGWVWGTDFTVFDDSNTVVAVQQEPEVVDVEALDAWLQAHAVDMPLTTFPLVDDVSMRLAACENGDLGGGVPRLAPGDYGLLVTQTAAVFDADGARHDVRRSLTLPLRLTAAGSSGEESPLDVAGCGASVDTLAPLADPQANPHAFVPEVQVGDEAFVGQPLPIGWYMNDEAYQVLGSSWTLSDARVVFVRDGVVVGNSGQYPAGATGGGTGSMFDAGPPRDCGGGALAAGDYDAWLVLDLRIGSTGEDSTLVAVGPTPITLTGGTAADGAASEPSVAQTAAWQAQRDALFGCNQAPDEAALAVALGLSDAQPRTTPVAIGRVDYAGSLAAWSATLTPWNGGEMAVAAVTVDVLAAPAFAFVGPDGRTAGYTVPNPDSAVQRGVVDEAGLRLSSGTSATYLVGCHPDGTATTAGAEEGLPAGTYTAYPMVPVVVVSVVDAPGAATAYSDGSSGTVLLVGPPQAVTFG